MLPSLATPVAAAARAGGARHRSARAPDLDLGEPGRAQDAGVGAVAVPPQQGVLPLYTPRSGSWLNLAEALQRIVVRRALDGQHPQTAADIITWLEDTVAGWNAEPTPFEWAGKRRDRRQRARQRRHGEAAAVVDQSQLFAA